MKKTLFLLITFLWIFTCCTGCSSGASSGSPSPSASSSGQSSGSSGSKPSDSSSHSSSPSDDAKTGNITISGSTALQPLLIQAVDAFKSESKFTGAVTVDGGGSVRGLTDVLAGVVDIGSSDVAPAQAGLDETGLVDHQVAVVAIGLAVSPDVAANLTDISTTDLKGIFTGAITDWSQVAGWKAAELPITVYYHGQGSGTRIVFEAYGILSPLNDEQISALPNFIQLPSAAGLDQLLGAAKGAIGYAAYPYCSNLSLLSIDGTEVSYDNVYSGKYRLWACEHLYTKGEPTGPEAAFVEFLKAEDFEKTITENGYGLISEMRVSR